jgi:hypothetical protein
MAVSRCRVSWIDSEEIEHATEVECESLFEAVGLAVAAFRDDDLNTCEPGDMTEFTVTVFRNPTEHKIRLRQVKAWAKRTVKDGPVGIIKRQRVRSLLGLPDLS